MLMGDSSKAKTAEEKEAEAADLAAQHMPADTLQIIGGLSLLSTLASLLPIDPATACARYGGLLAISTAAEQYRRDLNKLADHRERDAIAAKQLKILEESLLEKALFKPEKVRSKSWIFDSK